MLFDLLNDLTFLVWDMYMPSWRCLDYFMPLCRGNLGLVFDN